MLRYAKMELSLKTINCINFETTTIFPNRDDLMLHMIDCCSVMQFLDNESEPVFLNILKVKSNFTLFMYIPFLGICEKYMKSLIPIKVRSIPHLGFCCPNCTHKAIGVTTNFFKMHHFVCVSVQFWVVKLTL